MWKSCGSNENDTDLPMYLTVHAVDAYGQLEVNEQLFYRILLTNHVNLWKKVFSKADFQEMMLFSNEGVETDDKDVFLNNGLSMLVNPSLEDKKKFIKTTKGNINLELQRVGPIVWKASFELTLCDAEDFFYFITRPLLMAVKDQIQSVNSLRNQLIKKDQEIQGFLEILPENSPLMRCLRTKRYNDQEHQKNHCALAELFGSDPENVCPQQITQYERVLPFVKQEDDSPNSHVLATAIKRESDDGGFQANIVQIPTVKHEPTHIEKQNDLKTESNNGTSIIQIKIEPSELNPIKIETNDVTIESKDVTTRFNDNQPETYGVIKTLQSPILNSVKTNCELTATGDTMDLLIADNGLNTRNPTETLNSVSSVPIVPMSSSQVSPASTPQKRRKKLNY